MDNGIVTLAELRDKVRWRADMVDDPHVDDAGLTQLISARAKRLYAKLTSKWPEDFAIYSTALAITINSSLPAAFASVPSDFFKLVGVEASNSSGTWSRLRRLAPGEVLGNASGVVGYQLRAGTNFIFFNPVPPTFTAVRLLYVPRRLELSDDGDEVDGVNGWEEWLVLDCAIFLLAREESDTKELRAERDQLGADLEAEMDNRDEGEVVTVRNVRRRRC